MIGDLIATIAGLSGQELKTYEDPNAVAEPGFYISSDMARIEHWSYPCEYTKPISHAQHSEAGLLCDGFLSIISGDDAEEISQKLKNWHQHLVKYGVITQ